MYNSQYYTCEQIDERLLQGYLDDYNDENHTSLTKNQFLSKLGNIFNSWNGIDNIPVKDSNKFVTSGGIFSAILAKCVAAAIYDEEREQYQSDINKGVGRYVDNPEFLKAYIDSDERFIWGIQRDGNVVFGAGVPRQIKDYVLGKIAEIDFTDLLNQKVDKVEGKSLIDTIFAEGISYIENPEFRFVRVDIDNKIIEGVRKNGTKVLGADIEIEIGGDVKIKCDAKINGIIDTDRGFKIKGFITEIIENQEFLRAYIDNNGKILLGIKRSGNIYFCNEPQYEYLPVIRNLGIKPLTIAFVGDSIVEGYGSSDYNGGASGTSGHLIPNNVKTWYRNTGENCWVNKIINHLTTNYSNVVAVNNGIGGLKVSQVCANLPTTAVDDFGNKADVIIFSAGTNDRNESDKDNSITSCIKSTKDWCDRNNIQLIVLTNTPLMNTIKPNNDYTVSSAIKKACEMYNIPCVDLFSNMIYYIEDKNISLASIMNDNLHPNNAGYEIIYRLVKKLLKI